MTFPVRLGLKRMSVQDFNSFSIIFTTFLATHIKELESNFALLYFWTFAQCEVGSVGVRLKVYCKSSFAYNDI